MTARISIGEVRETSPTANGEPRFRLEWTLINPADGAKKGKTAVHRDKTVLDVFRAELLKAVREGSAFDQRTGLPSGLQRPNAKTTFDDTAGHPLIVDLTARMRERWNQPGVNGERKGHTVRSLTNEWITIAMALVRTDAPHLDLRQHKAAREWLRRTLVPEEAQQRVTAVDTATRHAARAAEPKDKQQKYRWRRADERAAARAAQRATNDAAWAAFFERHGLRWYEVDPEAIRRAIAALGLKVNGDPAEPLTVTKHFVTLNELMNWAVAHNKLPANPINSLERWERPSTTTKVKRVDQRQVPGMDHVVRLIDTCRNLGDSGDSTALRVVVFIAMLALAGLRPSEARALRVRDFRLPLTGWGTVTFGKRTTTPGRHYTTDAQPDEHGGLKWREPTDLRDVPVSPMLVALVRWHIEYFRLGSEDYLVGDEQGEQLATAEIDRVWHEVRATVFAGPGVDGFLRLMLKDLRHTRATLLLAVRVIPESRIATWLGHHTTVLRTMYEGVISGTSNPYGDELNRYRNELVPPEYDGDAARAGASDDAIRMLRQAIATGIEHNVLLTLVDALAPSGTSEPDNHPTETQVHAETRPTLRLVSNDVGSGAA